MQPAMLFPDAERLVVVHLRATLRLRVDPHLQEVNVATRMPPATTPGRYLLVRRVGGTRASTVVDAPRIDIMAWHDTDDARMGLAQFARGQLLALPGHLVDGTPVYRVGELTGPINMPDPLNDSRTVTMLTVEIRLRGAAA